MIAHAVVVVGTTATNLLAGQADNFQDVGQVTRTIAVQNNGTVTAYLGGPGVSSSSYGFALAAGQSISFDLDARDVLYAAVASGTSSLNVLHLGI